jgi:hypothetical protein
MIKIANAPCSWGVFEFDLGGEAVEGVRKQASRVRHFHFKNHEPSIAMQAHKNE